MASVERAIVRGSNAVQQSRPGQQQQSGTTQGNQEDEAPAAYVNPLDRIDHVIPRTVEDYEELSWLYLLKLEAQSHYDSSKFLANQTDISGDMRSVLIDWLMEVHHKFK